MPLESGLRDRIISACKEEQFETAADLLVGDSKNSVTYEEVVSSFKKIGPTATGSLLNSINNIYQRNSGNLAMLKAKLHNVSSSHSMVSSDQQTTEMDPSEIDKDKLGHRISALRIKQKQMIAKNGHPDAKVAQQLSSIIAKKQNLEVHDYGDSFQKKNSQVSDFPVPGAKHWFVLPEESELDKYEDMIVVVGSPITDVLRGRYERSYKLTIRDDIRHSTSLTSEEQFKRKKEIDRERAFVSSYKDTSMVEDQDVFVHQVASRFITDQHDVVKPQIYNKENGARHYQFSGGKLIDIFDRDSKMHSISIEGSIPGAFTVSIKRRTESGRIIDDVYDIVEFRDGRASNYVYSSKGNVALGVDDIRRSVGQVNVSLEKPRPTRMFAGEAEDIKEEVRQENLISPLQSDIPALDKVKDDLPDPPDVPKRKSPLSEEKVEKVDDDYIEEDSAIKPSGGAYNKGFLEAQLRTAVAGKKTSKMTIRYLVDQLAEAEGRRPEDLAQEFGITDLSKKYSAETEPVKQDTPSKEEPTKKASKKLLTKEEKPKKRKSKKKKEKQSSEELMLIKQELKKTFQPTTLKKSQTPTKPKKS